MELSLGFYSRLQVMEHIYPARLNQFLKSDSLFMPVDKNSVLNSYYRKA